MHITLPQVVDRIEITLDMSSAKAFYQTLFFLLNIVFKVTHTVFFAVS